MIVYNFVEIKNINHLHNALDAKWGITTNNAIRGLKGNERYRLND